MRFTLCESSSESTSYRPQGRVSTSIAERYPARQPGLAVARHVFQRREVLPITFGRDRRVERHEAEGVVGVALARVNGTVQRLHHRNLAEVADHVPPVVIVQVVTDPVPDLLEDRELRARVRNRTGDVERV